MREITASELRERLARKDSVVLLDVRQPEEFQASHIEGARLIPLGELPARVGELNATDDIIVNCKSGGRSARVVQFLMAQGFATVANLVGGNDSWQAETKR